MSGDAETDAAAAGSLPRQLLYDFLAGLLGVTLALVLLWYLHQRWLPQWALLCGGLGGILTRRWVRPSYASFPSYLRIPLSLGLVALGTLLTTWATLVREPLSYWLLRWREATTMPLLAGVLGLGLASLIYTHRRLERELEERGRLEDDLQVASKIQQGLLRERMPSPSWIGIHAVNLASRQVGGDYYEIFAAEDGGICVAVGDVSGKGVPAALLMSSLQSSFLAAHAVLPQLDQVCAHVNRFLFERTTPERYATFFVAHLARDGVLSYVNAGHNPPLLLARDGIQRLDASGMPLGLFAKAEYQVKHTRLRDDDVLVIYTDGVTEAANDAEEEFGESRLLRTVSSHRVGNAADIASAILDSIAAHTLGKITRGDDVTMVVVKPHALRLQVNAGAA